MTPETESIAGMKWQIPRRELSPFFAREMLFDYVTDQLDPIRKKAVEEHLKHDSQAEKELIQILSGLKYAESLGQLVVSQNLVERIQEPETFSTAFIKKTKFDKWPLSIKWSLEALIVVAGIVSVLVLIPWDKALKLEFKTSTGNEINLAMLNRNQKSGQSQIENIDSKPEFEDESAGEIKGKDQLAKGTTQLTHEQASSPKGSSLKPEAQLSQGKPPSPIQSKDLLLNQITAVEKVDTLNQNQDPKSIKNEGQSLIDNKISPHGVVALTQAAGEKEVVQKEAAQKDVVQKEASEKDSVKITKGFLYRGTLKITHVVAIAPKITDKISALGGRKAGEVELGWRKSESSFYYHFTIPEAQIEELKTFLQNYATVNIVKESHPRLMPDGIVRLILQIEEKNP